MFAAIQRAFYVDARDPSDLSTLIELARESGLDTQEFTERLGSDDTHALLAEHFELRDRLGAQGFPTLVLEQGPEVLALARGFAPFEALAPTLREHGAIV